MFSHDDKNLYIDQIWSLEPTSRSKQFKIACMHLFEGSRKLFLNAIGPPSLCAKAVPENDTDESIWVVDSLDVDDNSIYLLFKVSTALSYKRIRPIDPTIWKTETFFSNYFDQTNNKIDSSNVGFVFDKDNKASVWRGIGWGYEPIFIGIKFPSIVKVESVEVTIVSSLNVPTSAELQVLNSNTWNKVAACKIIKTKSLTVTMEIMEDTLSISSKPKVLKMMLAEETQPEISIM